jgi:hypothetical protein
MKPCFGGSHDDRTYRVDSPLLGYSHFGRI